MSGPDDVSANRLAAGMQTSGSLATDQDEVPAHLLRRILSLSSSVGPDVSLDDFARRLAEIFVEVGDFPFSVVFFYDSSDDAFYAEAMHGVRADNWQDILAVSIPKRVYERVLSTHLPGSKLLVIRSGDTALADAEVDACFTPLLGCAGLVQTRPARSGGSKSRVTAGPTLYLTPLEAPGQGTIGFCASGRPPISPALGAPSLRALEALASQGAIFIENIQLYSQKRDEAAVSSALLRVAAVVGTTDVDTLVEHTLAVLPGLFGGQFAALLYLDTRRVELRMLEPSQPDGKLTSLTEIKIAGSRVEQLESILRCPGPVNIEETEIARILPERLVHTRNLRSALIIPLDLTNRPADALAVFWTSGSHRFRQRDFDVARGVSELVGVALSNAQLYADATARAEQLSTLYRTGQMMSSSLDLGGTLRTITAAAVQLTRSKLCLIYLIEPKSGLLDFVAGSGLTGAQVSPSSLRPGEGLLGRCALLGKPVLVDDLLSAGQPAAPELVLSADARSALFLPLIASGEVIGVLATAAETVGFFQSDQQQLLQAFANQAAIAIERGRLYAAESRRREVAELQQNMTQSLGSTLELRDVLYQVLNFASSFIENDIAGVHVLNGNIVDMAVMRLDDGTLSDEPFHHGAVLGDPLYSQMRASGSAIVVSDTRREPLWRPIQLNMSIASWIGVPLLIDGDYTVVLDLFSLRGGTYTQEDADGIAQLAQQVGFAVRNARFYAREHEAKTRLEELDQLRTDFVSTVSHELRTPLTGIKGFTETLQTYWTRLDDERKHHYLDRIYGASKRLQRLVQDLLFVSHVEGGTLPLTIRRVQLEDLISSAVHEVKQKYRGQSILLDVPDSLPLVLADADRAQQVLVNIMDNGVKYSPEGNEISVRCTVLPDAVKFTVLDRGPGIRPQDLPRLFTRFGKIDQVIRAGHVGTGLGLFISKQLVEQMNGVITVNSVVGEGSQFSFTLPRADL
ncbi:MAG: phoR [Chloroflexi bacterium]|nr:phoR [Chloroflexota bacterium]